MLKNICRPEWTEQIIVANYIRAKYRDILWTATASGLRTSINQAKRMKSMGLNRGVPDILIFDRRQNKVGLAIEMKRKKGGTLSPEQRIWLLELTKRGWEAVCCQGADEAIKVIDDYFSNGRV